MKDPNETGSLTCIIGDHWFYVKPNMEGYEDPERYVRGVPLEEETTDVFTALESLHETEETRDEYRYYACYLREASRSGKNGVREKWRA